MPKKRDLIEKLCRKPIPRNFSKRELDILMGKWIIRLSNKKDDTVFEGHRRDRIDDIFN